MITRSPQNWSGIRGFTWIGELEWKERTHSCLHRKQLFHFLESRSEIEPSTKALQDAVIHACSGVEVIPQGPPKVDHMANGRVKMAVREVKRQCRTLRISAEQTVQHSVGFLFLQRKS